MKRIFWVGALLMVVISVPVLAVQAATPLLDASCTGAISAPTIIRAGARFNATITVKNTGLTSWLRNKLFYLGSQDPQDNNVWGIGRVALPLDNITNRKSVTFTIAATAPSKIGTYPFVWQMVQEKKAWFGEKCTPRKQISVIAPLVTPTPVPTSTITPTPTPTNKPVPDIATQIICPVVTNIVRPPSQQLIATLRSTSGTPLGGLSLAWTSQRNILSPTSSVTNSSGQTTTTYILPFDAGVKGEDKVGATFREATIGGVHYLGSSCAVSFTFESSKIPTPTASPTFTPIPTGIVTPTPYPSTPTPTFTPVITVNPYDGQTPIPNPYDAGTPQPNPYTNTAALTATITSPAANTSILKGQPLRVSVSGNGSPTCGTWSIVKPSGQTVVLTASDFASGQLPGGIAPCNVSPY